MTNQEAFTKMVQHLRKQGCKSQDEAHQTCLYRGPNGLKCAVGALIPDEEYREWWDEEGVMASRLGTVSLNGLNHKMLEDMQQTHDHFPVDRWEEQFKFIAEWHHLSLPPPEASHV